MPLACVENTEEKQRAPGGSQNCVLCSSLFTAVLLSIGQFKELRVEDDTTMISSEIKIVYLARDDDHLHYEGLKNSHEQKLLKMRKETVPVEPVGTNMQQIKVFEWLTTIKATVNTKKYLLFLM